MRSLFRWATAFALVFAFTACMLVHTIHFDSTAATSSATVVQLVDAIMPVFDVEQAFAAHRHPMQAIARPAQDDVLQANVINWQLAYKSRVLRRC